MDTIREEEYKGLTIKVYPDEEGDNNPREWENLGTMVCWHRRYNLGDEQSRCDPQEYVDSVIGDGFMLPLYLYDHSGISISCASFVGRAQHAEWDSGQVGYIYVSKDKVRQEYKVKRISKRVEKLAYEVLRQEVQTYDQFLTGDVYGFVVEDQDENNLDSCWGFFGLDDCIAAAKEQADYIASQPDYTI